MKALTPRILLLGGLEPSGRMGLLADVETVLALKGVPLALPTALTAQGREGHTTAGAIRPVTPAWMQRQLGAVLELGPVHAVKVGMVPTPSLLREARAQLPRVRWVVDPVVRSSGGLLLSRMRPRDYLALASARTVLTPNALEAGWLLGLPPPRTAEGALDHARRLLQEGFGGIVVKGGHLEGTPVDVAVWRGGHAVFRRRHRLRSGLRGTGCRFGSALAVALARGGALDEATRQAHVHLGKILLHSAL